MNNPTKVKIKDRIYPINTDFRIAIECNQIALDTKISDYERSLAIIYKLYGDKGLENVNDYADLLELAKKYLSCGKEIPKENEREKHEPDMDYIQDMDYIKASFMSDYRIDLDNTQMHWWTFYNLINGLSNSELGNCCILNRIRNLRNYDTSTIKDPKEKRKIEEAKKQVALHKKEKELTKEQLESIRRFNELIGLK